MPMGTQKQHVFLVEPFILKDRTGEEFSLSILWKYLLSRVTD